MTELDDLQFDEPLTPANPAAPEPGKCKRHQWGVDVKTMENVCIRCFAPYDPIKARRARNNAKRGKAIQRQRITALGGQNLPGNKPNHDGIGVLFSYESKSGGFFSERVWRVLRGIPATAQQTRVLIVTDTPGPGYRARSYVVVEFDEWMALHKEAGNG